MRAGWIVGGVASVIVYALAVAGAEHAEKLPPGPIRDRHELMEGIGKNAKIIGEALKISKFDPVAGAAEKIQAAAPKITALFPPGSTDPKSRAKPEIWTNWTKFEENAKQLETNAGALAAAAKSGDNVPGKIKMMFDTCKSCHDQFRVPEKKKKEG